MSNIVKSIFTPLFRVVIVGSIYFATAHAEPLTLKISPGAPNHVTFTSIAPLETIIGKTSAISGTITFDPDNLSSNIEGVIEVEMATLDTDNKIRDGHMRKNHLHTHEFPLSRFTLKSLISPSSRVLESGKTARLKARGSFLCHGVANEIEPEIIALWDTKKRELQVEAIFNVKLSDYKIPRPQFLVMKLDETQVINVKFTAK